MPVSSLQRKCVASRDIGHAAGKRGCILEAGFVAPGTAKSWGLGMLGCSGLGQKADGAGLWDLMLWEHPMATSSLCSSRDLYMGSMMSSQRRV